MVKNPPANVRDMGSVPESEDPWRRKWQPVPVFLLGKPHGQRSLASYSSRGPKELDMMEYWNGLPFPSPGIF